MKFTLSWLKEHLDTDASLTEITDKLTALGLELEGVEDRAAKFKNFVVAEIAEAVKHPDADRLKLCKVNTGSEELQVVCGAPNARTGLKGVFAPVGTYIPGSDFTLKKGNIRGQESCGMMCSEREMELSDEHAGIIELPQDAPIGMPYAQYANLDDPVIDIALTPDRGDCAGVRGIARDLAAAGLGTLKPLDIKQVPASFDSPISVHIKDETACPFFIGRMIKNVKNGPSPQWLQDRLTAIGLRPISALVDVTNYFSHNLTRPLHVFDADKLDGDLSVRLSQKGESIEALDEKTYQLDDEICVIADSQKPHALGGVMGGLESGCSDETTNVFLEVAIFDVVRTAKSGRKLGIVSDARYRFERGIDPGAMRDYAELATQMILDLCGGEASELVIAGKEPKPHDPIALRFERCKTLGGVDVDVAEQKRILETLGFILSDETKTGLSATPPSWRHDVEGEADLVEEILRVHGYEHIPTTPFGTDNSFPGPALNDGQRRAFGLRQALAGMGLQEAVTWSFMGEEDAHLFGETPETLHLLNPISADLSVMRPSIMGNLIRAAGRNGDRGFADVALFEMGPTFQNETPQGQTNCAAAVRAGLIEPRGWRTGKSRTVDVYDAKQDILMALAAVGGPADKVQIEASAPSYYHPGRSGTLKLGPNVLGYFGEISPIVLETMDIDTPMVGFELFYERVPLPKNKSAHKKLLQLSPLQPVSRDLAFVVDETVGAGDLVRAIAGVDKNLITAVNVFDIYQGKGIEDGKKSIALGLTLQPVDQTLTDEQIDALMKKAIEAASKRTGAVLRG